MSVLVTGAAGFIGRRVVSLLAPSTEVWALARSLPPDGDGRARWIAADLTTPDFTTGLPPRVETVVHLAQSRHYRDFPDHALDVFRVNVSSTAALLDWSRRAGVRRFVLASTGGVGRPPQAGQLSYYLATKRSAELLAGGYRDCFAVVILRFFFVYGPGQPRAMLVPRLIDRVAAGQSIALAGEQGLRLNPVHIDDAASAVAEAAAVAGHAEIDIAGPEVLTLRAMCDLIGQRLDRAPRFVIDGRAASDDLVGDIGEMSRRLHAPTRTFAAGLHELLGKR